MIGYNQLLLRGYDSIFTFISGDHRFHAVLQILLDDLRSVILNRKQSSFVDNIGKLCATRTGSCSCDCTKVNILAHANILGMYLQNGLTSGKIRQIHRYAPVKATRAKQGLIQRFRAIGSSQNDDTGASVKAIHFCQQLIQRLLTFIITADPCPVTLLSYGVNFIDKHDTRRLFSSLLEQITDSGSAAPDKHLYKFRTAD